MKSKTLTILLFLCYVIIQTALLKAAGLHDAHIHYSQDVWSDLPVALAIDMLKQQGIERALVSATPTEGAEKLYHEAPQLVVPMLRPYKNWRHRFQWFNDPSLKNYIQQHLQRVPYQGIGEFHVFGNDALSSVVKQVIAIAQEKQLVLHAHSDYEGIVNLLNNADKVKLIWAHGGFDVPVDTIRALLVDYPELYIELSYREGIVDSQNKLTIEWYRLFTEFPDRFLLGHDTYKPSRWAELPELVDFSRSWLSQLPVDIRQAISRNNFDYLFPLNKGS